MIIMKILIMKKINKNNKDFKSVFNSKDRNNKKEYKSVKNNDKCFREFNIENGKEINNKINKEKRKIINKYFMSVYSSDIIGLLLCV